MHLHFNTTDLRWAISLAGAIESLKIGAKRKFIDNMSFSFEPTTPLIEHIANNYGAKPQNVEDYVLPSEAHYPVLDNFAATSFANYLRDQHGILQAPNLIALPIPMLAQQSLLITHGLPVDVGYFFPEFTKSSLRETDPVDGLVEEASMIPVLTVFLEGLGCANPKVVSLETVDELTGAKMLSFCKAFAGRPYHPFQYILRSKYTGFDNIVKDVPSLAIIDDSCSATNRYLLSWNAQLATPVSEPIEMSRHRGKVWALYQKYDFDHRKIIKAQLAGEIS